MPTTKLLLLLPVVTACAAEVGDEPISTETDDIIGGYATLTRPEIGILVIGGGGCTGTLISDRVVLTAAHCLSPAYTGSIWAPLGSYFRITDASGQTHDFAADRTLSFHPQGDVAVVHLTTAVPLSLAVPATIAAAPPSPGAASTVYGYGCNSSAGTGWGTKRSASLVYGQTTSFLCPGDSGGPVTLGYTGGNGSIWGINITQLPDRFAPVSYLLPQIESAKRLLDGNAEVGYDRPGFDFGYVIVASAELCNQRCDSIDRCKAWSYVPSQQICYLKDGVPDPISSNAVTSGLVRTAEPGFDRPGSDYEIKTYPAGTGSTLRCAADCRRDPICKASTFVSSTNQCWLKDSVPARYPNAGVGSSTVDHALEVGYDRPGGDFVSMPADELDDCEWNCTIQDSCKAFVYSATRKMCWLKSAVTPAIASPEFTTGVRRGMIAGTSLMGDIYRQFTITEPLWPAVLTNSPSSASIAGCQAACANDIWCEAWTVHLGSSYNAGCVLSMHAGAVTPDNRAVAGYKGLEYAR